jgi:hypothetical protein
MGPSRSLSRSFLLHEAIIICPGRCRSAVICSGDLIEAVANPGAGPVGALDGMAYHAKNPRSFLVAR